MVLSHRFTALAAAPPPPRCSIFLDSLEPLIDEIYNAEANGDPARAEATAVGVFALIAEAGLSFDADEAEVRATLGCDDGDTARWDALDEAQP